MLVLFLVQALAFALVSSAWLEPRPEVRRGAAEAVRAGHGEGIQHYRVVRARPAGERADLGHGLFAAELLGETQMLPRRRRPGGCHHAAASRASRPPLLAAGQELGLVPAVYYLRPAAGWAASWPTIQMACREKGRECGFAGDAGLSRGGR